MKAITIPQPWAQLIACGFKTTLESRWELTAFPTRVLNHAGPVDLRYKDNTLPDTVKPYLSRTNVL